MEGDFIRQLAMSQREAQADGEQRNQRKSQRDIVDEISSITQRMQKVQRYLDDRSPKLPEDLESAGNMLMILGNQKKALAGQLAAIVREAETRETPGVSDTYTRGFGGTHPTAQDTMQVLQMAVQNMAGAEELVGPGAGPQSVDEGWRLAELAAQKQRTYGEAEGDQSQMLAQALEAALKQAPWGYRPRPGGKGYFDPYE